MEAGMIRILRESISGEVVLPEDSGYEFLRQVYVHSGNPAVIARCADAEDVRLALAFARQAELTVSVRSGGHSHAGFGTNDGGLVIDLSLIKHVELIDRARGVVRIGSGARWGEVAAALARYGLAISSGDATTVGVGGTLLGGGIGWLARAEGLAVDRLVAARLVTADGRVLRVSADEHSDLFWAIRGGGGNFGVVTSFDVAARSITGVHFGTIAYPAVEASDVLKGWGQVMRTAPDHITTTVAMYPGFGDDPPPLTITVCYAGDDSEAAAAAVEPLLQLGTVIDKNIRGMPYARVLEDPSELPPGWIPTVRSAFARVCDVQLVDALLDGASGLDTLLVEFRALGGAVRRVPADETAFGYRDDEVLIVCSLLGSPEENAGLLPGFASFWKELAPFTRGSYGNFLSETGEEDVAAVYPPRILARLSAIKGVYDPGNVFHRNPNIRPRRP